MQDFTDQISAIAARLDEASGYLRIDELKMRQPQLEAEASRPDLWDDQEKARKVTSELSAVNEDLELYDRLRGEVDDLETLHMMAREENDESLEPEIAEQAASIETVLDELEMRSLFTGEFDERDAVCQIKSGEGGTDAQDWAEMLMRMYNRWADKR
ncbi:MAG: PCRF domain-containing protein, partial [Acidimicrobiaceae bacterium]